MARHRSTAYPSRSSLTVPGRAPCVSGGRQAVARACATSASGRRAACVQAASSRLRSSRCVSARSARQKQKSSSGRRAPAGAPACCFCDDLRGNRRLQHRARVAQRVVERACEIELARPRASSVQNADRAEVPEQGVEVGEVAQSVVQFALVEQVRGAVQHHIGRARSVNTRSAPVRAAAAASIAAESALMRAVPGRIAWWTSMTRAAPQMAHRRDLVHPGPVVALVVGAWWLVRQPWIIRADSTSGSVALGTRMSTSENSAAAGRGQPRHRRRRRP